MHNFKVYLSGEVTMKKSIFILSLCLFYGQLNACESVKKCLVHLPKVKNLGQAPKANCKNKASEKQVKSKRVNPWKLAAFGVGLTPIVFFTGVVEHEASHAIVIKMSGGKIVRFKPYPHTIVSEGRDDRFVWGSVGYTNAENMTPEETALSLSAPMILDAAVISTYGGLALAGKLPKNPYGKVALLAYTSGHIIDLTTHILARNELTDTKRVERYFQENKGWSKGKSQVLVRGTQAAFIVAGATFVGLGIRDLVKSNRKKDASKKRPKKSMVVTPDLQTGKMGLTVSGRF